jgi:hypothetical protein
LILLEALELSSDTGDYTLGTDTLFARITGGTTAGITFVHLTIAVVVFSITYLIGERLVYSHTGEYIIYAFHPPFGTDSLLASVTRSVCIDTTGLGVAFTPNPIHASLLPLMTTEVRTISIGYAIIYLSVAVVVVAITYLCGWLLCLHAGEYIVNTLHLSFGTYTRFAGVTGFIGRGTTGGCITLCPVPEYTGLGSLMSTGVCAYLRCNIIVDRTVAIVVQ